MQVLYIGHGGCSAEPRGCCTSRPRVVWPLYRGFSANSVVCCFVVLEKKHQIICWWWRYSEMFGPFHQPYVFHFCLASLFSFCPSFVPVCVSSSCCFVRAAVIRSPSASAPYFWVICILSHLKSSFCFHLVYYFSHILFSWLTFDLHTYLH